MTGAGRRLAALRGLGAAVPTPTAVAERLRTPDLLQVLALFLAALLFVLAVRWPGQGEANEAWFALAQTRMTLLALAALGYGAAEGRLPRHQRRVTAAALMVFVAVSLPFDVAAYAASFPAVPLLWAACLPFLEVPAYFGMGILLGRLAHRLRVTALLPLLVPALLVAGIALDVRLGVDVIDPLTAPLRVSWVHLAVITTLAAATVLALTRGHPDEDGASTAEGAS